MTQEHTTKQEAQSPQLTTDMIPDVREIQNSLISMQNAIAGIPRIFGMIPAKRVEQIIEQRLEFLTYTKNKLIEKSIINSLYLD